VQSELILFVIFLVFTGAALFGGLALYTRQSLLVAYIVLGGLLGPWGLALVVDAGTVAQIGHVGIIFLLFLLGLNLHPQKLWSMLREAVFVTLASSAAFAAIGMAVSFAFDFNFSESLLVGAAMMFSSTIIGLKLLPTTELHHRHKGEVIISVLLLQDVIAIVILLFVQGFGRESLPWHDVGMLALTLPGLVIFAFLFERYVLVRLIRRFDTIQEYIFLTALGWCMGLAQLAHSVGLSYEIGAFVAGVALATSPIARFIAESLKPLRDFFLIMFFFSLGASFELPVLTQIAAPACVLALSLLALKPVIFKVLLTYAGEAPKFSWEIGFRLGQISEFSFMIAVLAINAAAIGNRASYVIQAATLITFIVSPYVVMWRYPTPISVTAKLRQD
jgi:Kef-type K+ transport system membrane component KefB